MKKNKYIFLISFLSLTACTQNNEWPDENRVENTETTVHLNLQYADVSVDTRSTTPQDPQTDNPMYHLYLLHYNVEGQLIEQDTQEKDLGSPQLGYQWSPTLRVSSPENVETICLVANLQGAAPTKWPGTLAQLKETFATLQFDDNGLIASKKMYMFGYYEGTIKKGQNINIMMGRMASTLKIVISCPDNTRYRITKIKLENVSQCTYYFPHNSIRSNFNDMNETFASTNDDNTIGNGLSLERNYYYQTGENIAPVDDKRTRVVITALKGKKKFSSIWSYDTSKNYTVVLGTDTPGTPERNYSLYRNNNYTFNIQLSD